jgi:hypothetical protein
MFMNLIVLSVSSSKCIELSFAHCSALPQSKELKAAIQHHRAHTPMLENTGHHASVMRILLGFRGEGSTRI